jgi:hypothetical protein
MDSDEQPDELHAPKNELRVIRATEHVNLATKLVDKTSPQVANRLVPISRLPPEILVIIFEANQPGQDDFGYWELHHRFNDQYLNYELPPIIIASHVNRRFRAVAIHTPGFWTNVYFTLAMPPGLLDAFLERSAPCSLSIWLRDINSDLVKATMEDVLEKIIPHSTRWHLFSAVVSNFKFLKPLVLSFRGLNAPRLKVLKLGQRDDHGTIIGEGLRNPDFFLHTPSLDVLELNRISMYDCWPSMAALTDLTLDSQANITYEHIAQALAEAPLLKFFNFHSSIILPQLGGSVSTIRMPCLLSLQERIAAPEILGRNPNLYSFVIAPQLLSLCVSPSWDRPEAQATLFLNFIREHGRTRYPALFILSLLGLDCSQSIDANFVHALPLISSVCLTGLAEDVVVRFLSEKDTDPHAPFWPLLSSLEIATLDIEILCGFISHRITIGHPLKFLKLISGRDSLQIPGDRMDSVAEGTRRSPGAWLRTLTPVLRSATWCRFDS